ncbi:hypothetical protein EYV94_27355 [Puteibacter caeruleilacunae]|nr:hypothetical protein EYV94_27355 [Puteibacter caeruleilacunae]
MRLFSGNIYEGMVSDYERVNWILDNNAPFRKFISNMVDMFLPEHEQLRFENTELNGRMISKESQLINKDMSDINIILADYRKAASAYGKAMEERDSITVNKEHEKLTRYYAQLQDIGGDSFVQLKKFLEDNDRGVLLWAATHLLDRYTDEAIAILKKLKQEDTFISLMAEPVLDLWENGRLDP